MTLEGPTLIAEIGATYARLAFTRDGLNLIKQKSYKVKAFNSIESLFNNYFKEADTEAYKAILGVAAPILGDEVNFINIQLKFSQGELRKKIFKEKLIVLNDLELQAHGIRSLTKRDLKLIGEQKKPLKGSKILVSPGTGLGLAGIVNGNVVATEAGHLNIPSSVPSLSPIQKKFEKDNDRMATFEDFLSGKGIGYIYSYLSSSQKKPYKNEEIINNLKDPFCLKTKSMFSHLLSIYLRNMALIWGALSGVYISGSMANSLMKHIDHKDFRNIFEDSNSMKDYLKNTPLFLIQDTNLGLRGGLKLASNSKKNIK